MQASLALMYNLSEYRALPECQWLPTIMINAMQIRVSIP
jgi:hypothetical protein